jgi:predicted signal transduction protein with EAL and GGDEF domain
MTVSIGIALGPQHAMNPRELAACAEAGMMTAKTRGKNQFVLFDEEAATERPASVSTSTRDLRSISHLKMLQSLAGKLNRLNDVRRIGETIAEELRLLIDYHNCRVVLREGDDLRPVAFIGERGETAVATTEAYTVKVGEGARDGWSAASRCSSRTRWSASSRSASRAPTTSRSRSRSSRFATAGASREPS